MPPTTMSEAISPAVIVPEAIRPDLKLNNPTGPFQLDYVQKNYVPAGGVGRAYDAFLPMGADSLLKNLQLQMQQADFDDRKSLLGKLDGFKRTLDKTGEAAGLDAFQRQAADVLVKGIAEAFDTDPGLENLMLAPYFTEALTKAQKAWRHVVATAATIGVPVPSLRTTVVCREVKTATGTPGEGGQDGIWR